MNSLLQLDGNILLWIQEYLRYDFFNHFWIFITSLGNAGWFWIALSLGLAIHPKTRKTGFLAIGSMILCALITNVCLKNLICRPRPYTQLPALTILIPPPKDWSFPSGHTTVSFACAWSYYYGASKKAYAIPGFLLATLIAFSRLYVGVHYPTDILGGFLCGTIGSWVIYHIYRYRTSSLS